MKSLKVKFKKSESQDWSKHDEKLLQAVDNSDPEKVASLLNKRTLLTTKLDTEGRSAYHLAVMRGHVDCLDVILAHGVDVTALDGSGLNALHLAAKYGNHQCVKRLLQEKCPVNAMDNYGRIALHHAAMSGSFSCVQTLCNFKSPLNVHDDDGCTPLILAAQMSNYEMCRCLIVRGGDVNSRDKQGRTALMLACENDSVETVDVLVRSGANVGLVDALGHDARHYSMVTGNTDILQLLHLAPHRSFWSSDRSSSVLMGGILPACPPEVCTIQPETNGDCCSPSVAHPRNQGWLPVLAKEKSTSPRKRQAPLPPSTPSTQNDQRLSEEIDMLQQERQHLLQTISNLEQLVDKCQREKVLIAKDCGIQKLENQIQELTNKLTEKEKEHRDAIQQAETLKGRLILYEQGKHQDNESELMVEEETLDNFPVIEKLLSKKGINSSSEEWLVSLQSQVESLTSENQELQGRLQELEYLQKGANEGESSESLDFVPVLLYDALQAEFEKLKEQYEQSQAAIMEEVNPATSEKLVSLEAYQQLKVEHEQEVQRLQDVLDELKVKTHSKVEDSSRDETKDLAERGSKDVEELIKKLKDTQDKYEVAMSEIQLLEEQIQLGILSVEVKATMRNTETIKTIPEQQAVKMEYLRAGITEVEEEKKVKALEEKVNEMEKILAHSIPLEEYNGMRMSLNTSLEEISRENLLLTEKYTKAEGELKDLKRGHFEETAENGTEDSIKVKEQLDLLSKSHNELQEECRELQAEYEKKVEELKSVQLSCVPKAEHEEVKDKLNKSLREANKQLHDLKATHNAIQQKITRLEDEIEQQRVSSIPWAEHTKMRESLEKSLQDTKGMLSNVKDQLATKEKEISQRQLEMESMKGQFIQNEEHEKITSSLKAEVNSLVVKLNDLTKKHEKTCTEVFRVQREALFMKSEKQAAEEEVIAAQKQLSDLKAESTKIMELQKHIEDSAGLVKEKDKKITELSKEVFKLKEALNSLSEKLNAAALPPKPASHSNQQHTESTQRQIRLLQQQLAVQAGGIGDFEKTWPESRQAESEHRAIVTIYRSHLLYAVQGQMDEEVQNVLLQILKMHKHHKQAM
ncbi:ankycorbin [Mustelus asterias]